MLKKILVADDEEEIIELIKSAFEREGYLVLTATHGSSLEKIIKTKNPDLLVLDVMLPGVDGYSLALQLSQDDATKNLPVIVMTAMPASKILFDKIEQVKLFLTKPFEIDVLVNKANEIHKTQGANK